MGDRQNMIAFKRIIEDSTLHFHDWQSNDLQQLSQFLKNDSSFINEKYPEGETALSYLLKRHKCPLAIVELLLEKGANINCSDSNGNSALHSAVVSHQCIDIIQTLVLAGARIGATRQIGRQSLLARALANYAEDRCVKKFNVLGMLVKHAQFENEFEMDLLIRKSVLKKFPELGQLMILAKNCMREVNFMKSLNVSSGSSLHYFVKRRLSPRMAPSCDYPPLSDQGFKQTMSIVVNNNISHYVDIIAYSIGRQKLSSTLQDCYGIWEHMNSECSFNVDIMTHMIEYIPPGDLVRLMIAFAPNNYFKKGY